MQFKLYTSREDIIDVYIARELIWCGPILYVFCFLICYFSFILLVESGGIVSAMCVCVGEDAVCVVCGWGLCGGYVCGCGMLFIHFSLLALIFNFLAVYFCFFYPCVSFYCLFLFSLPIS